MTSGSPDWAGLRWKVEVVQRPNLMYPSGKIILYDDFETATSTWGLIAAGGGTAELSTAAAYSGQGSVHLIPSNNGTSYASMGRDGGMPLSNKVGIQFAWCSDTDQLSLMRVIVTGWTIVYHWVGEVRYDHVNGKWQYYDSSGSWEDVPNGTQAQTAAGTTWHMMKLIVDYSTGKYVRLYSDADSWDLSDISMRDIGATTAKEITAAIGFLSVGTPSPVIYVDDVAITEE